MQNSKSQPSFRPDFHLCATNDLTLCNFSHHTHELTTSRGQGSHHGTLRARVNQKAIKVWPETDPLEVWFPLLGGKDCSVVELRSLLFCLAVSIQSLQLWKPGWSFWLVALTWPHSGYCGPTENESVDGRFPATRPLPLPTSPHLSNK